VLQRATERGGTGDDEAVVIAGRIGAQRQYARGRLLEQPGGVRGGRARHRDRNQPRGAVIAPVLVAVLPLPLMPIPKVVVATVPLFITVMFVPGDADGLRRSNRPTAGERAVVADANPQGGRRDRPRVMSCADLNAHLDNVRAQYDARRSTRQGGAEPS
jgi:hypothetical protein